MLNVENFLILILILIIIGSIIYTIIQYKKDWREREEKDILNFEINFKLFQISIINLLAIIVLLIVSVFYNPIFFITVLIWLIFSIKKVKKEDK